MKHSHMLVVVRVSYQQLHATSFNYDLCVFPITQTLQKQIGGQAFIGTSKHFVNIFARSIGSAVAASRPPSMAPKQQAALLQQPAAAPPSTAAAAPRRPRGLTAARFYGAVVAALEDDRKVTIKQVRAVLLAIDKVVMAEFAQEARQVTVPYVCRLSIRKLAARPASTKMAFGKQVELKERAARRALKATPAKTLKGQVSALVGAV